MLSAGDEPKEDVLEMMQRRLYDEAEEARISEDNLSEIKSSGGEEEEVEVDNGKR